jgi:hypothetical protein
MSGKTKLSFIGKATRLTFHWKIICIYGENSSKRIHCAGKPSFIMSQYVVLVVTMQF